MDIVNDLSLQYLVNPNLRSQINKLNINEAIDLNEKEKYKDSVIELTKSLFNSNIESKFIKQSFNDYFRSCLKYLKHEEQKKKIRENGIKLNNERGVMSLDIKTPNKYKNTMDKYVIKKNIKKKKSFNNVNNKYETKNGNSKEKTTIKNKSENKEKKSKKSKKRVQDIPEI